MFVNFKVLLVASPPGELWMFWNARSQWWVYYVTAVPELWVCYIYCSSFIILLHTIIIIFTHHREITISTGVLVIDLAVKFTKQPPLLPGRLKEGRYLSLVMGAMDAEWREDHNALGLRFIRWLEGKICPIYCFWCATGGVHCKDHITIYLLLLRSIMIHWIGENIIFNNQPG